MATKNNSASKNLTQNKKSSKEEESPKPEPKNRKVSSSNVEPNDRVTTRKENIGGISSTKNIETTTSGANKPTDTKKTDSKGKDKKELSANNNEPAKVETTSQKEEEAPVKERKRFVLPKDQVPYILNEDRTEIDRINDELDRLDYEIDALTKVIDAKSAIRRNINEEQARAKANIKRVTAKNVELLSERKKQEDLLVDLQRVKNQRASEVAAMRQAIDSKWNSRPGLDYRDKEGSLEKIQSKIKKLTTELENSQFSLNEEKKRVAELSSLRQLTKLVSEFHDKQHEATDYKKIRNAESQIKHLDNLMAGNKEYMAQQEEIEKIAEKRYESIQSLIQQLVDRRKESKQKIKDLNVELTSVKTKIESQRGKHQEELQKKREQERLEYEKRKKEREDARQKKIYARLLQEQKQELFESEVKACSSLLKKLQGTENDKNFYLPLETIVLFETLSLPVPKSGQEVEGSVKAIEERKEHYLALRKQIPKVLLVPEPVVEEKEAEKSEEVATEKEEKKDIPEKSESSTTPAVAVESSPKTQPAKSANKKTTPVAATVDNNNNNKNDATINNNDNNNNAKDKSTTSNAATTLPSVNQNIAVYYETLRQAPIVAANVTVKAEKDVVSDNNDMTEKITQPSEEQSTHQEQQSVAADVTTTSTSDNDKEHHQEKEQPAEKPVETEEKLAETKENVVAEPAIEKSEEVAPEKEEKKEELIPVPSTVVDSNFVLYYVTLRQEIPNNNKSKKAEDKKEESNEESEKVDVTPSKPTSQVEPVVSTKTASVTSQKEEISKESQPEPVQSSAVSVNPNLAIYYQTLRQERLVAVNNNNNGDQNTVAIPEISVNNTENVEEPSTAVPMEEEQIPLDNQNESPKEEESLSLEEQRSLHVMSQEKESDVVSDNTNTEESAKEDESAGQEQPKEQLSAGDGNSIEIPKRNRSSSGSNNGNGILSSSPLSPFSFSKQRSSTNVASSNANNNTESSEEPKKENIDDIIATLD